MEIRTDGFYLSEPFHWIDNQASVNLEGNTFYILRFDNNKCYFDSVNDKNKLELVDISQKVNYGFYRINKNEVEILYKPNTEFELKRFFTILSPEVLIDENLKEYKFVKYKV